MSKLRALAYCALFAASLVAPASLAQVLVLGSQTVQPQADSNSPGVAEAFTTTAVASGSISSISVYVDAGSTATRLVVGLYANNAGRPGTLLTQGSISAPTAAAWNSVPLPSVNITSGTTYWIAILGPAGSGTIRFRDRSTGARAETSSQTTLTALPQTWTTGNAYGDSPLAAYAMSTGTGQPILSVAPASLSFTYTLGGTAPAALPLNVTNTGTGTLSFTTGDDATWLSVTPASGTAPQSAQVSVAVAGLAAGTYTGNVTITSSGAQGSPAVIPVTLVVNSAPPPPPILSVAPASLSFTYTLGGTAPAALPLNVTNTGTGTLNFTTGDNATWLSVSPASGTAPQAAQVSVAVAGLAAGTYTGNVTITSSGAQGSPAVVPVTLVVNPAPPQPILSVAPASLSFTYTLGGTAPAALPLNVTNTGTGTLNFTTGDNATWLSVSPASGTAPQAAQVSVAVAGLAAGTYTGNVTITSSGAQGSPAVVPVTLVVNPAPPQPILSVAPASLSFTYTLGGTAPAALPLNVTNTGTGTLNFTTGDNATWLSVSPASGTAPQAAQVSVAVAGLAEGTYSGQVTITATGAQGSPTTIPVTLVVNPAPPQPILSVAPASLSFTYTLGGTAPAALPLNVTNTGTGTLSFTTGDDAAWLSVTPASGTAPQSAQVSVAVAGLAAGTYTGNVTIAASGAQGSPTTIPVTLVVNAAPPQPILSVAPASLSFAYTQGGTAPAALALNVTNTGTGTLNFTTSDNATWLSVSPASGTAPQAAQVSVAVAGLAAGTYTGNVTITSSGAQGSPAVIPVTLVVSPAPPSVLVLGSQTVQPQADSNAPGMAEAFTTTAVASGSISSISVYVDAGSTATRLVVGLYANNAGRPGTLLTQGSISAPTAAAWNSVPLPSVNIISGTTYWIAILGPAGSGTIRFRDRTTGARAETSAATNLSALPQTWTTGTVYGDSPLAAYAMSSGGQPVLSVAPTTLSFSYTQGGVAPAALPLNVSNTGTGTLSFTTGDDATWLSVTPASGTAPQSAQVGVAVAGLAAGTYTGNVTITASGAQGSPAVIPVTLVVNPAAQPILSVSPASLSFNYFLGEQPPSALSLSVQNAGIGTLTFSAGSNAAWLSATPAGGTTPMDEQVTVSPTGLAVGTYSGQITIAAASAQNSPVVVPVTFTISDASRDWPMVNRDPSRSGFAANDSTITADNASTLALEWTASVDGKVVAQPLFLSAIDVGGQTRDVVIAATAQNSLYALDASTGQQLWKRNFGADFGGCQPPGGSGIRSAPVIDRTRGRIYVVPDDGTLRTIAIADGNDAALARGVIDLPATNKVRGGLNLLGNNLYLASGSGGCDDPPWRGRIYRVDLSGPDPVVAEAFDVIPTIIGNNRGGGIWGYGGVAIDPATGNVIAATGADASGGYTPYGVRLLSLSSNLTLQGSYEPPHPATIPCHGTVRCDIDFGATPIVFQPTGCPTLVAAGNKNGFLYLLRAADLATSAPPLQALRVNPEHDWLGTGGLGGIPAYWPDGRMVFVTDAGPGVTGISGGMVALSVLPAPACTLQVAWSAALPQLGAAMSSPTVANGVVFVGEGGSGRVHAYNASTGQELWNTGTTIVGGTYAAPSIGGGKLFVGSWNGQTAADSGAIRAFAPVSP